MYHSGRPSNKVLHPTPSASLGAAAGAGERQRWADKTFDGNENYER